MRTILVVEDDPDMAAGLRDNLTFEGYDVVVVRDGPAALRAVAEETPHLVLLDVMIPKLDGFEVCRRMRQGGLTAPIIMLTARGQEIDKVRGLELGADDYVTKPFGVRELLARIKAALRRADGIVTPGGELRIGSALVDFAHARVRRGEEEFPLGHLEGELLKMLVARPGQAISRTEILNAIWGLEAYPTNRTVDNHIVSLRRKIEDDASDPRHILTAHGVGYKFVP